MNKGKQNGKIDKQHISSMASFAIRNIPEADERTRRWVSPSEAANMVDEPGLRDILRNF